MLPWLRSHSRDDNAHACAMFARTPESFFFLIFRPSQKVNGTESQPVKRELQSNKQSGWNGAQISSRLIWKLCNEGSTVYI